MNTNISNLEEQIQQLTAQLAAAREVIDSAGSMIQHSIGHHFGVCKESYWVKRGEDWLDLRDKALAIPCPAADALLEDKARLDWLSIHGHKVDVAEDGQIAKAKAVHYGLVTELADLREAIDAARKP